MLTRIWNTLTEKGCAHCSAAFHGLDAGAALQVHVGEEHTARCALCRGSFVSHDPVADLTRHKTSVHFAQCDVCDQDFMCAQPALTLAAHKEREHTATCEYEHCGFRCVDERAPLAALRIHHGASHTIQCDVCDQDFVCAQPALTLAAHKEREHTARCEYCGFRCVDERAPLAALRLHHIASHALQCGVCEHYVIAATKRRQTQRLEWHRHDAHGVTVDCSMCDSGFRDSGLRDDHEGRHCFECDWCDEEFCGRTGEARLRQHVSAAHTVGCSACDRAFVGVGLVGRLEAHQYDSHGITVDCTMCGQAFRNSAQRDDHELKLHVAKCRYCPVICGGRARALAMKAHVHSHHTVACDYCDETFVGNKARAQMEKHSFAVHGGWDCEICGREFRREADHARHEVACEPPQPVDGPGRWVMTECFAGRKSFGFFRCDNGACSAWWMSAHAQLPFKQQCKACETWVLPIRMWQNAHRPRGTRDAREVQGEDRGPHDTRRCEACRHGVCLLQVRQVRYL